MFHDEDVHACSSKPQNPVPKKQTRQGAPAYCRTSSTSKVVDAPSIFRRSVAVANIRCMLDRQASNEPGAIAPRKSHALAVVQMPVATVPLVATHGNYDACRDMTFQHPPPSSTRRFVHTIRCLSPMTHEAISVRSVSYTALRPHTNGSKTSLKWWSRLS